MTEVSTGQEAKRYADVAIALAPTLGRGHFSAAVAAEAAGTVVDALRHANAALE